MNRKIVKPWGYEEIWAKTAHYVGKILFIKKGHRLSLQHHQHKEENIRLIKGKLRLTIGEELKTLQVLDLLPGDTAHIRPKLIHRMEAIEDCEIVEVSTPELHDIIRHEDDYGRTKPSTPLNEPTGPFDKGKMN
ncbi:MAG: cupin [Myxococcota bacterium]